MKPCNCGSGLDRRDLLDAAGIFCCFVCDKCEPAQRRKYRAAIFEPGTRYAQTGDEEDIGG